jgi:hypothetical protein
MARRVIESSPSSDLPRDRVAAVRLLIGVLLCAALLAAFMIGVALAVPEGQSAGDRALGVGVLLAAVAGVVQLLRWARGHSWSYDRPQSGLAVGETFLLGCGCVLLFGLLVKPLGAAALFAFAVPVAPILRLRYGLSVPPGARGRRRSGVALAAMLGYVLAG